MEAQYIGSGHQAAAAMAFLRITHVLQVPVVGFIGRLDNQKGADLVLGAASWLLGTQDVQLICLGTGNKDLEVRTAVTNALPFSDGSPSLLIVSPS